MSSTINRAKGLSGASKHTEVSEFLSNGPITTGDWVMYDGSKSGADRLAYVVQGNATGMTAGVCLDTVASGGPVVRVVTSGYVEGAKTDTNVSAGDGLAPAASGACAPVGVNAVTRTIGIALENDSGTTCDVLVFGIR